MNVFFGMMILSPAIATRLAALAATPMTFTTISLAGAFERVVSGQGRENVTARRADLDVQYLGRYFGEVGNEVFGLHAPKANLVVDRPRPEGWSAVAATNLKQGRMRNPLLDNAFCAKQDDLNSCGTISFTRHMTPGAGL